MICFRFQLCADDAKGKACNLTSQGPITNLVEGFLTQFLLWLIKLKCAIADGQSEPIAPPPNCSIPYATSARASD